MDNYHITKGNRGWALKKAGSDRAIKVSSTKSEAVKHMQDYMKNRKGSVKIHKEDGEIQEERTYPRSADPKSSKG